MCAVRIEDAKSILKTDHYFSGTSWTASNKLAIIVTLFIFWERYSVGRRWLGHSDEADTILVLGKFTVSKRRQITIFR